MSDTPPETSTILAFPLVQTSKAPRATEAELELDDYQEFFSGSDFSASERRQLLSSLWVILTAFVDLGYGIHPTQRVPKEDDDFEAEVMASIGQEMRCAA